MKLLTREIEKKFEKYPLYSQDGKGKDAKVLVKFFNPYGAGTWIITEASREGDDWLMFGWTDMGYGWEAGYISYNELASIKIRLGRYEFGLERDIHIRSDAKVGDFVKDSWLDDDPMPEDDDPMWDALQAQGVNDVVTVR